MDIHTDSQETFNLYHRLVPIFTTTDSIEEPLGLITNINYTALFCNAKGKLLYVAIAALKKQ